MRTASLSVVIALGLLSYASRAAAQANEEQRARTLFEEARALVETRNCGRAIPKLKESLALHESVGAHLNLAQCYATSDPAEAWREDKRAEAMAQAAHDERAAFARDHARTLEARIALVRIALPAPADTLPGLTLRVDGAALDARDRDRAFPLAAGEHTIEVSASRKVPWKKTVTAAVGTEALVVPVLEDAPPPPPTTQAPETPPPPPPAVPETGARTDGRRTIAYVLGAAAAVGVGIGSYFGVRASSDWSNAKSLCGSGCTASSAAYDARDSARAEGNVATIAFVAAGAVLAGAIVLFISSARGEPRKGSASPVLLVGSF